MKTPLAALVVALIHGSCATLLIKGPTEPIMEGDTFNLECLLQDSEYNISNVHFEMYLSDMQTWISLPFPKRRSCFYSPFSFLVEKTADRAILEIGGVVKDFEGPYRCVLDAPNVTAPDNASELLSVRIHYLSVPSLSREGYSSYFYRSPAVSVRAGDNVVVTCSARSSEKPNIFWYREGDDWILPSPVLTLKKVSASDAGRYTCSAQHPTISRLSTKSSMSITVLPAQAPWYQTTDGQVILMTVAAVATCLMVILSVSVFLCRRAKKIKSSKGPIDDRSLKKPIYKSSAESLPITCGDKQPLV